MKLWLIYWKTIELEKRIYISVLRDIGWVVVSYQYQLYSTVLKLVNKLFLLLLLFVTLFQNNFMQSFKLIIYRVIIIMIFYGLVFVKDKHLFNIFLYEILFKIGFASVFELRIFLYANTFCLFLCGYGLEN